MCCFLLCCLPLLRFFTVTRAVFYCVAIYEALTSMPFRVRIITYPGMPCPLCPLNSPVDTASRKERSDFLLEIDMMKKISEGYCANIVNMVGCVTLQEPLCLVTEFVPHGDLLDYLRNQRKKVWFS